MKKRFINNGIFAAALLRIKTQGIISAIISCVFMLLSFVGKYISITMSNDIYNAVFASEVMGALPVIITVSAFIMTLVEFSYLNRRSSCDFFHAIPEKRRTVFFSQTLGVFTVCAAVCLITGAVCGVVGAALISVMKISITEVLVYTLGCVVIAFYVCCATALAMSITGTVFSNIVVTGIIVFFPRLIVSYFTGSLTLALTSTSFAGNTIYDTFKCLNMASGFIIEPALLKNVWAFIYTAAVGIGYAFLGAFLYKKRRSETAGVSAPSRLMQSVYRILLGIMLFFSVTALMFVYEYWICGKGHVFEAGEILVFLWAYVICAILYFLFELISTKKWKNVLKSLPGLGIIAVLCVAMYFSLTGIYNAEMSFAPTAEEIKSVSFIEDDNYYPNMELGDYLSYKSEPEEITDTEVKEAVARGLELSETEAANTFTVKIKTAAGVKTRKIYSSSEEDFDILYSAMQKSVFADEKLNMPIEVDEHRMSLKQITGSQNRVFIDELKMEDKKLVAKTAAEELREMTAMQWMDAHASLSNNNEDYFIIYYYPYEDGSIPVTEYYRTVVSSLFMNDKSGVAITVSESTLPKTYECMSKLCYEYSKDEFTKVKRGILEGTADFYIYNGGSSGCYIASESDINSKDFGYGEDGKKIYSKLREISAIHVENAPVSGKDLYVSVCVASAESYKYVVFPLKNVSEEERTYIENVIENGIIDADRQDA